MVLEPQNEETTQVSDIAENEVGCDKVAAGWMAAGAMCRFLA